MTDARWPLSVGGRLVIDGEAITVTSVDGADVRGFTGRGESVRFALTRVEEQPAVRCHEEWRFGSVLLDAGALSDGQLRDAAEFDQRYQQLLGDAERARRTAGFANANLTRALTATRPESQGFNYASQTQLR